MFKSSETGQVFKENQSLNNNIRYMLFSEGCFRVEDEEGGVKTIWPWSCVLALEHSSSEMCVCVCVKTEAILLTYSCSVKGSCPLAVMAFG